MRRITVRHVRWKGCAHIEFARITVIGVQTARSARTPDTTIVSSWTHPPTSDIYIYMEMCHDESLYVFHHIIARDWTGASPISCSSKTIAHPVSRHGYT